MEYIGIDLHKKQSQICILTEAGELVQERILTERSRFVAVFGERPKARILIEASTESEWVARCLEELGHEVIVADPNYAPMYAHRSRRVKTDRRDAEALAIACQLGAYRRAHRSSDEQRHVRAVLSVREAMVRSRVRYISLIRALLRGQGYRVRSGATSSFVRRVEELELPVELKCDIAPLLMMIGEVNKQLERSEEQIEEIAQADEVVERLCTAPGVGVLTATAFVATVDEVERFDGAHQLESYLGLVPGEWSSAEKQRRGAITKVGCGRTRWLLVEAAWSILHQKKPEGAKLRVWAERIAARRGKRVAAVALARRLAGILYAMWRDGSSYQAELVGRGQARGEVKV